MNKNEWHWDGDGLLWKRLHVRSIGDEVQGIMTDAVPSWINDKIIDLSWASTIDEAIEALRREDYDFHSELSLYADEG